MRILRLAWRNVWRNSRRSLVTIAAMAFALWTMVLYAGLVEGMILGMEGDVLDLEVGEVQIVAEGYRDDPSLYTLIKDPEAVLTQLDALDYPASARLLGGGLCAVDEESAGVQLVGLNIQRDAAVTLISERVAEGAWLAEDDLQGVVIGRKLATTIDAQIGDELLVLSQGWEGGIAADLYTVRGILGTVGASVDSATVFMNEGAFRALLDVPDGAHQITVRVPKDTDLVAATASIEGLDEGLDAMSWKELMPFIAMWLESTRGLIGIVYGIIYIAVAILVLNAMLMAVFERIREFGVMKAIGYAPSTVFGVIAVESAIQTAIGTLVGLLFALPVMYYLATVGIDTGALGGMSMMGMSMQQNWMGVYSPQVLATPIAVLWFMVGAAAMLPALRAARISPVAAMRHR